MDKFIQEFEALSTDAEKVQMNTLKRILEDNASAQYLQNLGLNGKTDPESFKACVPLVTHKDSEPYINRIIDGDASPILTTKPITAMSLRCTVVFFLQFHMLHTFDFCCFVTLIFRILYAIFVLYTIAT